jgi:hypothetical protein
MAHGTIATPLTVSGRGLAPCRKTLDWPTCANRGVLTAVQRGMAHPRNRRGSDEAR